MTVYSGQGTMMIVTYQIIVNLSHVHTFRGGSSYPEPFAAIVGAVEVLTVNLFQLFHMECSISGSDYGHQLVISTLLPIAAGAITGLLRLLLGPKYVSGKWYLMFLFYTLPTTSTIICSAFSTTRFGQSKKS